MAEPKVNLPLKIIAICIISLGVACSVYGIGAHMYHDNALYRDAIPNYNDTKVKHEQHEKHIAVLYIFAGISVSTVGGFILAQAEDRFGW